MSKSTYFVQGCPTCGRRLNIRVEYLGKHVVCQHCHGQFTARDPASSDAVAGDVENDLLRRADMLLESLHVHHAAHQDQLRARFPR